MERSQMKPVPSLFGHFRGRFISGLLVLVPLAITLFVLKIILRALTGFVVPFLEPWMDDIPDYIVVTVALAMTLILIYLVGLITAHIIGRRLIQFGEAILLKLPIVKTVYAASKQVVDSFSNGTQAAFQAVVLVEFPRAGALCLGFVTGTILDGDGRSYFRVFVPTTPNPTSGFLMILTEEEVRFTDISIESGLRMIVSGGVLAPERFRETQQRTKVSAPECMTTGIAREAGVSP